MRYVLLLLLLLLAPCAYADGTSAPVSADASVVEGVFSQVSKLPAAETNPYPDCYYTATLDLHHIVSGRSMLRKIVLVLPGFFSRKYAPEANYKVGDKVRAVVVPFASMPEKVRQTQQADEVEDVDLDFYYPQKIAPIADYQSVNKPVPFLSKSKKSTDAAPVQPVDEKAKAARRDAMQHDLVQIEKLLASHGGDWSKWYQSQQFRREQYKKQYEKKAQRWIGNSFFSAGYVDNYEMYCAGFVKSLVDFKNYLAARNVDLIVVRIPNKGEVVDDVFTSAPMDEVYNPYLLRMYKDLLEADVEVITDVIPKAKEKRLSFPLMYYYQDFDEKHPAEGISWVIAEELAKRIARYDEVKSFPKRTFTLSQSSKTKGWLGYTWPEGNPKFSSKEYVKFVSVVDDKGNPIQLMQGKLSPVLIAGSSFITTPFSEKAAAIPQYLAYLSGVVPDIFQRNDADFMIPRSIAREGDELLRGRSVCIFPFVPWVAYKPLASLPIFDPTASTKKTLLASYSGTALQKAVGLRDGSRFDFTPHSMKIKPSADGDATVSFEVALPEAVSQYPYFVVSMEFDSHDRSTVVMNYAGQSDSLKRIDNHPEKEELFAFMTKPMTSAIVVLNNNGYTKVAPSITAINVYGVKEPAYYNRHN